MYHLWKYEDLLTTLISNCGWTECSGGFRSSYHYITSSKKDREEKFKWNNILFVLSYLTIHSQEYGKDTKLHFYFCHWGGTNKGSSSDTIKGTFSMYLYTHSSSAT